MSRYSVPPRMLVHENQARKDGFRLVIGIDEAGRGPLAGPVVAAAVAIHTISFTTKITDSKLLSPQGRDAAFHEILHHSYVGVGMMCETVIDSHNILKATFFAMTNAVNDLIERLPSHMTAEKDFSERVCLLVDGNRFQSELPYAHRELVGGDGLSLSIAAASIVAKVTRDRILRVYDKVFPQYGFARHKGYPTPDHKKSIARHGLSVIHRKTFSSV